MLSWVVKVVPQPPEPPSKKVDEKKEEPVTVPPPVQAPPQVAAPPPVAPPRPVQEKKVTFQDECKNEASKDLKDPEADKSKQEAETAEGNGSQPGMLTWISGALPQPAASPKLSRDSTPTTSATEENTTASKPDDEKGMLTWFAQGLEKVVPQPDFKNRESAAAAEVHQAAAAPAEPQVNVQRDGDASTDNKPFPPRMMDWIKHGIEKMVPQPEIDVHPKTESNDKTEAPASTEAKAPPPEPPPPPKPAADTERTSKEAEQQPESSKDAEQQPNMMGRIFNGIGRMFPQPVQKQDTSCEVQNISILQQRTDLVLEDVEQDEDAETKNKEKKKKEDPEKQVDQQTSSIKKEEGEAVLAQMDERVQQERLEAARVAEDIARKAAEEAVRQLEVEHSAKIVIETLPESNEQLPYILEEENEEDPELQNLQEDSDDSINNRSPLEIKVKEEYIRGTAEEEKNPDECMLVCPAQDDTGATTDVEPALERRDLESPVSQPVTQQPQAPQGSEAAAAADEGGCGAPDLCSPVQSFLLRIPHAAECLTSCRKLMHDNYLIPPKLTMPTPPPELAQLTQELSQFRKQAQQFIVSHLSRLCFTSQQP